MRTINIALLTVVVVVLVSASSALAVISENDIEYLDFTGWDHALISGGGQSFPGLDAGTLGLVDVFVEQIGIAGIPSSAFNENISVARSAPGSNSYRFTFSTPLPLIITHRTTDPSESFELNTVGSGAYMQTAGAPVTISGPDGIKITGGAFGLDPVTGAAAGQLTDLDGSSIATVTYSTTAVDKFDTLRVGVLVPEPSTTALASIGLLGMVMSLRRRNK